MQAHFLKKIFIYIYIKSVNLYFENGNKCFKCFNFTHMRHVGCVKYSGDVVIDAGEGGVTVHLRFKYFIVLNLIEHLK